MVVLPLYEIAGRYDMPLPIENTPCDFIETLVLSYSFNTTPLLSLAVLEE